MVDLPPVNFDKPSKFLASTGLFLILLAVVALVFNLWQAYDKIATLDCKDATGSNVTLFEQCSSELLVQKAQLIGKLNKFSNDMSIAGLVIGSLLFGFGFGWWYLEERNKK